MPHDSRLVQANPAFQRVCEIKGNTVDAALEQYNLLEDAQASELTLLPLYKYNAQQTASDIGSEAGVVHERWIKGQLYLAKDDAGQLKNVVLKEVIRQGFLGR